MSVIGPKGNRVGRPKGHPKSGGRQKGTPNRASTELRDMAREYTEEAVKIIAKCMRDKDPDIRLRAVAMMLDRSHGKPSQAHNIGGPNGEPLDFSKMSMQEIDAIVVRLESAIISPLRDDPPRIESGEETTH